MSKLIATANELNITIKNCSNGEDKSRAVIIKTFDLAGKVKYSKNINLDKENSVVNFTIPYDLYDKVLINTATFNGLETGVESVKIINIEEAFKYCNNNNAISISGFFVTFDNYEDLPDIKYIVSPNPIAYRK
jgi:hypothetical protein